MKKIFVLAFLSLSFGAAAAADEPVVAATVDDLRSDPSLLESRQYFSTGQPDETILKMAKAAGYVAVVDLRTEAEDRGMDEPAVVEAAGLDYYSIPVAGAKGTTFANARALDDVLADIDGPVLLHCRTGNRVGALLALRASQNGASREEALEIGRNAGMTSLEEAVIERLDEK